MKKKLGIFLFTLCMCLGLWNQTSVVWAANGKTSVAVSSNNVNIGDTVTVTVKCSGPSGEKANAMMTLSYDSSILQFVNCSTTYGGGGGSVVATGESYTVTLKAISAGSSSLSVSGNDGVIFDTNEELDSMSGTSAAVVVNNAAGTSTASNTNKSNAGTGSTGTNNSASTNTDKIVQIDTVEDNTKKSADNSLKTLTISPGTLSPSFQGSTVNYTATVANDVTSIAVSAVPVHANAVVESVSGNEGLKVGTNPVKIVVKAENGVTATYTIQVTRLEAGAEANQAEEQAAEVAEGDVETDVLTTESAEAVATEVQETEAAVESTEVTSSEITYLQQEYNELLEQYEKDKSFFCTLVAILVFVIAVLVIVIINLLIQKFRNDNDDFFDDDRDLPEDDDSYDDDDEDDVTTFANKKKSFFARRAFNRADDLDDEEDDFFEEEKIAPKQMPREEKSTPKQMPREEKSVPKQMPREEKSAPKQMPRAERKSTASELSREENAMPKQVSRAEKTAPKTSKGRSAVEEDLEVIDFNDL